MATGYCSVCQRGDIKKYDKAIADGWSYNTIRELFPNPPAKATHAKHKAHTKVVATKPVEATPLDLRPRSNKEVLEAIRDLGLRNALENPESITVNQAIRAASVLAEKDKGQENITIIMAKLLQGPTPVLELDNTIEGEWSDGPTEIPVLQERA